MRISDISDDDLVFLRADGTPSENAIYTQENKDGEIMFFELLGQSKLNGIKLTIDGKEPYRRLLIRRVYPAIKNQRSTKITEEKMKTDFNSSNNSWSDV